MRYAPSPKRNNSPWLLFGQLAISVWTEGKVLNQVMLGWENNTFWDLVMVTLRRVFSEAGFPRPAKLWHSCAAWITQCLKGVQRWCRSLQVLGSILGSCHRLPMCWGTNLLDQRAFFFWGGRFFFWLEFPCILDLWGIKWNGHLDSLPHPFL